MSKTTITANGQTKNLSLEPRRLLADVLREDFRLSGVHIGCAHGACGACTVHVDGVPRLSCLTFAVQCDGAEINTVESLGGDDAHHLLQRAFREEHGLQCGYCTPGFLMTMAPYVEEMAAQDRMPEDAEIRHAMSGNICRCTGYQSIVAAVRLAITQRRNGESTQ
ncbi:(2Fe-2S)-binding protein [Pararhodobacter oceanensis]|uniref:(2Fe-2S)-binding protein n=1 Tax=Pararhodobacter oceanensis TaxID=2172121 RepID=A0A2T8HSR5_9RHOB|nr:(2Fe-2S)-binding protein [Pararhodobacter oceanensis]PVH28466.1 (2Fe-2S)-binding protein [Pararhodobacter oceanensis]